MLFHQACPYHGPTLQKYSRATHQLQDKIWQVEMHRLHSHCEVVLFMYTRTDVLHWLLWLLQETRKGRHSLALKIN